MRILSFGLALIMIALSTLAGDISINDPIVTESATEQIIEPITEPVTEPTAEIPPTPVTEPALETHAHEFSGKKEIVTKQTCEVDGLSRIYCTYKGCGEYVDERIPAFGHTLGEWETIIPATYETSGVQVVLCNICGKVIEEKEIAQFVLGDFTPPVIRSFYSKDSGNTLEVGELFYFNVYVEDNSLVESDQYSILFTNGISDQSSVMFDSYSDDGSMIFKIKIVPDMTSTLWTLKKVELLDKYGNASVVTYDNNSEMQNICFYVSGTSDDLIPPIIDNVWSDQNGETINEDEYFSVYISAEDDSGLSNRCEIHFIKDKDNEKGESSFSVYGKGEYNDLLNLYEIRVNPGVKMIGVYRLYAITLYDIYNNKISIQNDDLQNINFNIIERQGDTTPPIITGFYSDRLGEELSTGAAFEIKIKVIEESEINKSSSLTLTNGVVRGYAFYNGYDPVTGIIKFRIDITENMSASRWYLSVIQLSDTKDNTNHIYDFQNKSLNDIYFNVIEHRYQDLEITKAPTCSEIGFVIRKCIDCGQIVEGVIPLLNHTPSMPMPDPTQDTGWKKTIETIKCIACEAVMMSGEVEQYINSEVPVLIDYYPEQAGKEYQEGENYYIKLRVASKSLINDSGDTHIYFIGKYAPENAYYVSYDKYTGMLTMKLRIYERMSIGEWIAYSFQIFNDDGYSTGRSVYNDDNISSLDFIVVGATDDT